MADFTSRWLTWAPRPAPDGAGANSAKSAKPTTSGTFGTALRVGIPKYSRLARSFGGESAKNEGDKSDKSSQRVFSRVKTSTRFGALLYEGQCQKGQKSPPAPVDPYGALAPTTACYCCRSTTWYRAGAGWVCARCHPPPGEHHYVAGTDADLDTTLLASVEHAGFPALPLGPGVTVLAGQDAWQRFAVRTTSPSLRASALAALRGRESGEEG